MKVDWIRLLILTICVILHGTKADTVTKRQQCRDFAGDISNCQRFIRCFHNLRVLFTCPFGTLYVPELKTCVAQELVTDCDDSKNRIEISVNSNTSSDENDDYPTVEADLNALEVPMQKSFVTNVDTSSMPRQFGCSSFCYNQGVCVLTGQAIACRCAPGFIGIRCQVAQSAISTREVCNPGKCLNGATCIDIPSSNTHICVCAPGWAGDLCDYPEGPTTIGPGISTTSPTGTTPCPTNPCLNGAACYIVSGGGFRCACTPGYTGLLCDAPAGGTGVGCGTVNPCLNAGVCLPTANGNICQCAGGYIGSSCQTSTATLLRNYCVPNPCQNGGSCYLNGTTGFACACRSGYAGTCCEIVSAQSNPCLTNPCENGGTCQVIGSGTNIATRCVCNMGFLGARCEHRICDPNPCLYGGVCLPYGNSFECQCPPQYTGRCCELLRVTTAPPNPCTSQPCLNGGTCTATSPIAFVCSCTASYYGRCCEVRNYCQPSPCYNGGTCVATSNAYICQCTYPYSGSNCELTLATRPSQPTCACILCPCPTPAATSTNPCLPNPCQNNGGCAVVQSAAQCYCPAAFTGYYCQFTRKRSLIHDPCNNVTCLNGGICHADEQGAHCTCPQSYFGERCELINRPRTCNPSPCGKNGQCITTKEGHKCICKNGTTGVLCEQILMPPNYRWCPLNCPSGTNCIYEGSTPKCRVLSVY